MPLMPKRVKYRKHQKARIRGRATRGNSLYFGEYGMLSVSPGLLTSAQIEAARVAITHYLKSRGKVWIKVFPDKAVSKGPAESRMGGGKGDVHHWVAVVPSGRVVFEVGGVESIVAKEALRLASHKLPIKTKIISRIEM